MEKPNLTLGEQVYSQRKKCGLTQGELYSKSKISIATIGALEQNRKLETSSYILRQISKALNHYEFKL